MDKMTFEDAIKRLEEISGLLNEGVALEKSIELYEEATRLIAFCTSALNNAQLKITRLSETEEGNINE